MSLIPVRSCHRVTPLYRQVLQMQKPRVSVGCATTFCGGYPASAEGFPYGPGMSLRGARRPRRAAALRASHLNAARVRLLRCARKDRISPAAPRKLVAHSVGGATLFRGGVHPRRGYVVAAWQCRVRRAVVEFQKQQSATRRGDNLHLRLLSRSQSWRFLARICTSRWAMM
jgi:hypothetical protein